MTEATESGRKSRRRSPRGRRADAEASAKDPPAAPPRDEAADASERMVARRLALGTPLLTLATAALVALTVSLGPALLVLAGGALFGTIAFFWASLRTLGGDAPLAEGFEGLAWRRVESPGGASERKRTALRALKDLELEHSIGKIDDADYAELSAAYRERAKDVLRELDGEVAPYRERAETLARGYLEQHEQGSERSSAPRDEKGSVDVAAPEPPVEDDPPSPGSRRACWKCSASNEGDATFCKGCGARLSRRDCSACATPNEPDAAFCKSCGKAFDAPPKEKVDASA